jgi:ABC-2 type transport system permease protein
VRRQLNAILAVAGKDWQLFFADKRAALLCFVVPIALASAFGLIFARPTDRTNAVQLPLLVVLDDAGPFTRAVAEDLVNGARVDAEIVTADEARRRVNDRQPGIAVVFPAGFETLASWKPGAAADKPTVRVLYNPLCHGESLWAEGVVSETVMRRLAKAHLAPFVGDAGLSLPFAVAGVEAVDGHHGFNAYSHSFSGMTLQYLLFWGMESGLLLLRDRQRSLWLRTRAAPVSLSSILLGKALSTAAIAFLQVLVTFAFGHLAFGVTVTGSFVGFLLLAVSVSALAAATGLLVAAVGGTEARARSVSILLILGVSMLGGLWLPSFVLPGWARDLALSLPTTWAMRGFDGVTWQGGGLWDSLTSTAAVVGFAALFLAVAVARLITSEARRRRGLA